MGNNSGGDKRPSLSPEEILRLTASEFHRLHREAELVLKYRKDEAGFEELLREKGRLIEQLPAR